MALFEQKKTQEKNRPSRQCKSPNDVLIFVAGNRAEGKEGKKNIQSAEEKKNKEGKGKQQQIVLERSTRLNLDPGRGD